MDKYQLKFGISSDNDPSLGIHKGKIALSNQELKLVFDTVIDRIATSCLSTIISKKAEVI